MAYLIRCTGCVKDEDGRVSEIHAVYDPMSRGGDPADGRKGKGATLHWVDARNCIDFEARLYSNLFSDPEPDAAEDYISCLNPDSLKVLEGCKGERCIADVRPSGPGENEPAFQFMRLGYFALDNKCSKDGKLVFNETVALKDGFKR